MKRALLLLAACGHAAPAPAPVVAAHPPPADAPAASQEEVLAAIQKAMNELVPASQQCWARAATDDFRVAGDLTATIEIDQPPKIDLEVRGVDALADCMKQVLARYPWAPPLRGQTIKLPFQWQAPQGQSVIDRSLVSWRGQSKVSVAVLLDEANTGNASASMLEVAIAAGGSTERRLADRTELWYFLGPAQLGAERVGAGDMVYVPKGASRELVALDRDVHAVLVLVPGGREGAARAGALPMRETSAGETALKPLILRASAAQSFGAATIFLDDSIAKGTPLAASILQLPGGAKVPEHVHAKETELLYVLSGSGTMTIAGTDLAVTATSAIQIPANTKHAFAGAEPVRALQIYTPAGPEQRFKK